MPRLSWYITFAIIMRMNQEAKGKKKERNARFKARLSLEELRRRDRRIPRVALALPGDSPFERLFNSGSDQALITVTGFCHRSFALLEALFTPYFEAFTPYNHGGNQYHHGFR